MSETKWTPGPWRVISSKVHVVNLDDSPVVICRTGFASAEGDESKECLERWEADARLIAAAPDLYSVLETAVMQGERILNGEPPAEGENFDGWFLAAKAALAKARGEQS